MYSVGQTVYLVSPNDRAGLFCAFSLDETWTELNWSSSEIELSVAPPGAALNSTEFDSKYAQIHKWFERIKQNQVCKQCLKCWWTVIYSAEHRCCSYLHTYVEWPSVKNRYAQHAWKWNTYIDMHRCDAGLRKNNLIFLLLSIGKCWHQPLSY